MPFAGAVGKLHDSHFLPKSVYRLLRRSSNGNVEPGLDVAQDFHPERLPDEAAASMQRLRSAVCAGVGENYVVPLLNNGRGFSLLDRLKLALPLYTTATNTAFVCSRSRIVGREDIGYFGLSILWRAAVRPWRTLDGDATSVTLDPAHLELVRGYLAGETPFPDDSLAAVTATVATDFLSQNTCFVPSRVRDDAGVASSLLTKGLCAILVFGENHPPQMRAISCIGPGPGLDLLDGRRATSHGRPVPG